MGPQAPGLTGAYLVLGAMLLWSSLGIIIRTAGVPVQYVIFYSNLLSAIALGLWVLGSPVLRGKLPRGGKPLLGALALGPVTALNSYSFFFSLKHTTIANAMLTHYLAPVFVAVLAAMFLKEALTPRVVFSLCLACLGLWMLLGMGPGELISLFKAEDAAARGILAGMASGVFYALLVILVRALAQGHDPIVLAFLQNVMMCLCMAPFISHIPWHAWWSFVIVGALHSTLAPIMYIKGLSSVRANQAAILGYIEPVSAVLLGVVFLGEYPGSMALIGGGIILFSGYMTIAKNGAPA